MRVNTVTREEERKSVVSEFCFFIFVEKISFIYLFIKKIHDFITTCHSSKTLNVVNEAYLNSSLTL